MDPADLLFAQLGDRLKAQQEHFASIGTRTAVLIGLSGAALGAVVATPQGHHRGDTLWVVHGLFLALVVLYVLAVVVGLAIIWASLPGEPGYDPRDLPAPGPGQTLVGIMIGVQLLTLDLNEVFLEARDVRWRRHAGLIVAATLLTAIYALVVVI